MKFSTTFTTRQTPLTKSDIIYHHWSIKWHYLKKKKYQFCGGNIFILVSKRLRKNDEKVNFFSRFKRLINLWNTRKQEGTFFRKKRCLNGAWKWNLSLLLFFFSQNCSSIPLHRISSENLSEHLARENPFYSLPPRSKTFNANRKVKQQ